MVGDVEGALQRVGVGLLAIVLLNVSVVINDRVILRGFSNEKEILTDQNADPQSVLDSAAQQFTARVLDPLNR